MRKFSILPRSMSQARFSSVVAATGADAVECELCRGLEHELKLLPCGHKFCKPCLQNIDGVCPKDQEPITKEVPSLFYGQLPCQLCKESKWIADTWWCAECRLYFCSKCQITTHSIKQHPGIVQWESLEPVRAACAYLNGRKPSSQSSELIALEGAIQSGLSSILASVPALVAEKIKPKSKGESYEDRLLALVRENYNLVSDDETIVTLEKDAFEDYKYVAESALSLVSVPLPEKSSEVNNVKDKYSALLGKLHSKLDAELIARYIVSELNETLISTTEPPSEKPPPPPLFSERPIDIGEEDTARLLFTPDSTEASLDNFLNNNHLNSTAEAVSGETNMGGDWWKMSQDSTLDRAGAGGSRFGMDSLDPSQIGNGSNGKRSSSKKEKKKKELVFEEENKEDEELEGEKKNNLIIKIKSKLSRKKKSIVED